MKKLTLLASLLLTACVNVQAVRLGDGPIYAPITPDRVSIYRTAEQVGGPYAEVALLSAAGDYSMTTEEQMYSEMRKRAAALGANGIILDSLSEPTTGAKVANAFLGTMAERRGKAIAIRKE